MVSLEQPSKPSALIWRISEQISRYLQRLGHDRAEYGHDAGLSVH